MVSSNKSAFREIVELSLVPAKYGDQLSRVRELRKILVKLAEQEHEAGMQDVMENPGDFLERDYNEGYV